MSVKLKGYTLAAISAITYGMIPLFAIPLKQMEFSFDTVLFYRFLISALLIGIFLAYRKINLHITIKEGITLSMLGLLYSFSAQFLFLGYDYMPAGVASTILFLYPILVAIIMGIGFKEKISVVVWIAIILGFLGVFSLNGGGSGKIPVWGIFIVFLSALSYALYMVVVNKSNIKFMQGIKVSFYSMVFCAFFFLIKSLTGGTFTPIPTVEAGIRLVLFALVTTVISLITLVFAIKLIGSTPTAIMGSLEPLVAVAVSVLLFQEPFTIHLIIGIFLILDAVLLTILSDFIIRKWKCKWRCKF